jgi:hypothetical protein
MPSQSILPLSGMSGSLARTTSYRRAAGPWLETVSPGFNGMSGNRIGVNSPTFSAANSGLAVTVPAAITTNARLPSGTCLLVFIGITSARFVPAARLHKERAAPARRGLPT